MSIEQTSVRNKQLINMPDEMVTKFDNQFITDTSNALLKALVE
jgi:hypothetical protein